MSKHDDGKKLKYESPVIVPFGAMAKGSGDCEAGSTPAVGLCVYEPGKDGPYGSEACDAGGLPVDYCQAGTTATAQGGSFCEAGTEASDYCSAGTCAPGPAGYCTDGTEAGDYCEAGADPAFES